MLQRVHLITLGVEDIGRSRAFYDALGWEAVQDTPEWIVTYQLWGAALGLYPREKLEDDMGRSLPGGSGAVTLACNVREKAEVAGVIEAARSAGAEVLREPADIFWGGHVAYFADPDGHVWEVAWNPFSPLGPDDEFTWEAA